jgi:hypothetical protein
MASFGGLHTRWHGARLHHRNGRQGALWSGALFWPSASLDLFDYTFAPYAYESFWPYSYPDIYQGIFADPPVSAYAAVRAKAIRPTDEPCGAAADTTWPVQQIVQQLNLTDAQRAAFDALNHMANPELGFDMLSASSSQALPETPTSRIEAMRVRLVAMLRGIESMRPLLARFYSLLTNAQKTQLDWPATAGTQCGEELRTFPVLPHERVVRELQVNGAQRAALCELQQALTVARAMTQTPCAGEDRLTLMARLDRVQARLDAGLRALEVIEPALTVFYGLPGQEQKNRFNQIAAQSG